MTNRTYNLCDHLDSLSSEDGWESSESLRGAIDSSLDAACRDPEIWNDLDFQRAVSRAIICAMCGKSFPRHNYDHPLPYGVLNNIMLVGIPGSGKSSVAKYCSLAGYHVISTDAIRYALYGSESILGSWNEIQEVIEDELASAYRDGKRVCYDATNCKQQYRRDFLQLSDRVTSSTYSWDALVVETPLQVAVERRSQPDIRNVPPHVILKMHEDLTKEFPVISEGYNSVFRGPGIPFLSK